MGREQIFQAEGGLAWAILKSQAKIDAARFRLASFTTADFTTMAVIFSFLIA
jgi:hypothetical protein